jgi:hypothetical protein
LNSPNESYATPRKLATCTTDSSSYVSSTMLSGPKKTKITTPVSSAQRHIHGHKVIGQLNMVYETIQKPSYSEIYRKQPKQISPSKAPTYIFDKDIDGERKKSPVVVETKDVPISDVKQKEDSVAKSPKETIASPSQLPQSQDKPIDNVAESQAKPPASVIDTKPSQEKNSDGNVHSSESQPDKERNGSVDSTQSNRHELSKNVSQPSAARCESSFSAIHLASSPPRHGHMCGASSPSEAMCLKCSPRPRSTSPHVASSSHRAYPNSRPMLFPREYPLDRVHSAHVNCPRSVHSTCATGGHSPQNNNLSAAASVDLALHCDQCNSASVSTRSDPNLYAKMAPQEVPLNLHKPRSRSDP